MKRCPKCNKDFSDDANFCPVDAGHLVTVEDSSTPAAFPSVDTGGHELLIGRFGVGDILGGHRTGPVHSAVDKQGTTAIIKLVNPNVFPTPLLMQRTERELRQLERLEHPAVAKVLGHGRRGDGLWIATERVDGVPLTDFLASNGSVPQDRAIALLTQIGGALEEAAKLGVTHRDLSTKNILIADGDKVKIINFGVAVASIGGDKFQGIPEFVAPEQIDGRPVDQRCNIYSLGAIGYALLTGHPPFQGNPEEVIAAHGSAEPPPLTGVSDALAAVLLKALAKTSSKRFMTLRQFLGELEKTVGTSPSEAPAATEVPSMDNNKTLMGVSVDVQQLIAAENAAKTTKNEVLTEESSPSTTEPMHAPPDMTPVPEPSQPVAPEAAQAVAAQPVAAQAFAPQPVAQAVAPQPVAQAVAQPVAAQPAAPSVASSPGGKGKGGPKPVQRPQQGSKGKFRETMWFKKGELDQAAAEAAARAKPEQQVSAKADEMEMDVRYSDDGSITAQDQERLSLRTGATMMMEAVSTQSSSVKGSVSEADLVSEMTDGRNKVIIAGAAVIVIGIIIAVVVSM